MLDGIGLRLVPVVTGMLLGGGNEPSTPVYVHHIIDGGAVCRSAIEIGDVILAVNDHPVSGRGIKHVHDTIRSAGDTITFTCRRDPAFVAMMYDVASKGPEAMSSQDGMRDTPDGHAGGLCDDCRRRRPHPLLHGQHRQPCRAGRHRGPPFCRHNRRRKQKWRAHVAQRRCVGHWCLSVSHIVHTGAFCQQYCSCGRSTVSNLSHTGTSLSAVLSERRVACPLYLIHSVRHDCGAARAIERIGCLCPACCALTQTHNIHAFTGAHAHTHTLQAAAARTQRTATQPSLLAIDTMREDEASPQEGRNLFEEPQRGTVPETSNHHRASTPSLDDAEPELASPAISPIQQASVAASGTCVAAHHLR
eukprot:m.40424 g.40424  ORF g.40424 m.40424 type:complete len:362 (-) comp14816_c0_seq2:50-1135(-)